MIKVRIKYTRPSEFEALKQYISQAYSIITLSPERKSTDEHDRFIVRFMEIEEKNTQ